MLLLMGWCITSGGPALHPPAPPHPCAYSNPSKKQRVLASPAKVPASTPAAAGAVGAAAAAPPAGEQPLPSSPALRAKLRAAQQDAGAAGSPAGNGGLRPVHAASPAKAAKQGVLSPTIKSPAKSPGGAQGGCQDKQQQQQQQQQLVQGEDGLEAGQEQQQQQQQQQRAALRGALHLALASSYFTYPYTLASALRVRGPHSFIYCPPLHLVQWFTRSSWPSPIVGPQLPYIPLYAGQRAQGGGPRSLLCTMHTCWRQSRPHVGPSCCPAHQS